MSVVSDPGRGAPRALAFSVEVRREDGSVAGELPIEPDFGPAWEHARFSGIRRGLLAPRLDAAPGVVEPVFDEAAGAPWVRSLRTRVRDESGAEAEAEIGPDYLDDLARDAVARLARLGRIAVGERCGVRIAAREVDRTATPVDAPVSFDVVDEAPALVLDPASVAPLLAASDPFGPPAGADDDVPVVLVREALEEAIVLAHRAGDVETGGFLLGGLRRDPRTREIFVVAAAQIPAEHAVHERMQLSFTAETWAAAHDAISRRGRGETLIGWWHSHPSWCRGCPPEKRATCRLNGTFFSKDDVRLHHVCFPRAHQIALLLTGTIDGGLQIALFGWREGRVSERGYHLLRGPAPSGAGGTDVP